MTLFISAEEVTNVLDLNACIEAMRQVFIDEAAETAVNHPRQRYTMPKKPPVDTPAYWTNLIAGASASTGLAALRVDSGIVREHLVQGNRRMDWLYPSGRSWGFVILFELATGMPVAVFQDFSLSPIRVAATTATAVDALSRKDASQLCLFGSGNEAERHLEAICLVRPISKTTVFSPNRSHLESFAKRVEHRVGCEIVLASSPEVAMKDADIIMCATNSSVPVFDGNALQAGQFVATIVNTDHNTQRTEADSATFLRSDLIVLNSIATAIDNNQVELLSLIDKGPLSWANVRQLGEVLANPESGRQSDDDIIYYKSNCGVGIQFAAAGRLILDECLARGLGKEIPSELFGADVTSWLSRGFNPSP